MLKEMLFIQKWKKITFLNSMNEPKIRVVFMEGKEL